MYRNPDHHPEKRGGAAARKKYSIRQPNDCNQTGYRLYYSSGTHP
jgi:hypothetical protein